MTLAPEHPDQYHWWRDQAACAKAPLSLVDEAYRSPGGDAGMEFRQRFCGPCPVWEACLAEAMKSGEWGIWGGTSPHSRTRAGGKKRTYTVGRRSA